MYPFVVCFDGVLLYHWCVTLCLFPQLHVVSSVKFGIRTLGFEIHGLTTLVQMS